MKAEGREGRKNQGLNGREMGECGGGGMGWDGIGWNGMGWNGRG